MLWYIHIWNEWIGPEHLFRGLVFPIWIYLWVFPEIRVPQNGWFIMSPIKFNDLGVVLFLETPLYDRQYLLFIRYFNMLGYIHIWNPKSYLVNPLNSSQFRARSAEVRGMFLNLSEVI